MRDERRSAQLSADNAALSTLLRGELSADHERQLKLRLEKDPAFAARLEALERGAAGTHGAAARDEPLSPVSDLLRGTPHRTRTSDTAEFTHDSPRARAAAIKLAAMTAGIALLAGVMFGVALGSRPAPPVGANLVADAGRVLRGSALFDALQALPSGAARPIAPALDVTARLSFVAQDGRYCRQLDLFGERGTTAIVACRRGDAWQIDAASFAAPAAASEASRPTAGNSSAIDAAIDDRILSAPLGAAAEAELIARGWRHTDG